MKFKNIIYLGLLAIAIASCSNDDDPIITSEDVSFISQVSEYVNVKCGEEWAKDDSFGAFMLNHDTYEASGYKSSNIEYSASESGTSVEFKSSTPFKMPDDGSSVDFIGYYPYNQDVSGHKFPINLADQSKGTRAHDLMFSDVCSNYSKESNRQIPITFKHQLSKLIFVFKEADTENVIKPQNVTIKGMSTVSEFNMETKSLSTQSSESDIQPYKGNDLYEAIVLPSTITTTFVVDYDIDGITYSCKLSDATPIVNSIEKGTKYTYTIAHKKGIPPVVEVEVNFDASVTPWLEGEIGDGTAEFQVNYKTLPLNQATNVHSDTYLKLTFEGTAPTIGNSGSIRVFRVEDNKLVDEINVSDKQVQLVRNGSLNSKMDIILGSESNNRVVNYTPIKIDGNTVVIKLHNSKLDFDTKYYVNITPRVINHSDFYGIKNKDWVFTTKETPAIPTDAEHTITVGGDDSTADFRTIQAAMYFLSKSVGKDAQKTVFIQNGIYEELLFLRNINNMTLKGESRDGVKILYENYDDLNGGVGGSIAIDKNSPIGTTIGYEGGRALFLVEICDKLRLESLTIQNTHVKTNKGDQAEVIYANNDNKGITFINCNVLSCQDTLNLKGFCWFYNSLIAGDVDFIWGSPAVALFENCEIRSVNDGYVLQARVGQNNKGFIFLNCNLTTTGKATQMYLSRTASNGSFDNIVFINCKMDDIYVQFGWGLSEGSKGSLPNPAVATLQNGYKMYNCTDLDGETITVKNYLTAEAYNISQAEYLAEFSKRSSIFTGYAGGTDWFTE